MTNQLCEQHEVKGPRRRRLLAASSLALLVLAAAGCGGSDAPTSEQVACESLAGTTLAGGAYFSDRGRLEQADRGRRNDVAGEALG